MEPRPDIFGEIQRGISDLIAKSPAADLEKNIRALMMQTFAKMDLITREEFDTQVALLDRALERIQALEQRIELLEAQQPAATHSTAKANEQKPSDGASAAKTSDKAAGGDTN